MLKRRAFLLLGSAASVVTASEAQAFFMGGVGVNGLANLQVPSITSMTPNNGAAAGGNTVSFIGTSFSSITAVTFGGVAATNVIVINNDVMTCTAPLHANGAVDVILTNQAGPSIPTVYTYGSAPVVSSISPAIGPVAGGTPVQIFGSSFTGATEVRIGGALATAFVFVTDAQVNCTTPAGSGVANVVVTNPNGSGTLVAAFTYTGAFSTSIPLGTFTAQQVNGGFTQLNTDGTTTGYNSGGGWTVLQFGVSFPANDFYKFVVPAYCSAFTSIPANSLQVLVDQLEIPADTATLANRNWFIQFVSNLAPSQNYSFTAPVTQGWHSIQIRMNNAAYYGTGAANNSVHGDRLNINSTGTGLPAEPAGNRDPGLYPCSSYHFINTPFGANATWLALNNPKAQTINGTGGNGASIFMNASSFTANIWPGQATDPIWSNSSTDNVNRPSPIVNMVYPCPGNAGLYQSGGSDGGMTMYDTANPRFQYIGAVFNIAGRIAPHGHFTVQDSYNLNHASPQEAFGGYGMVRIAELDTGVIAHRMIGGLAYPGTGGAQVGFGPGQQTSKTSGMPWPGCDSDHDWKARYLYANGPDYASVIGIPPNIAKPAGLNAATSMLWDAFQNYGCFLNVSAGNVASAAITVYAEGSALNHPMLTSANFNLIVPNLSIMSNPAPIIVGQGFGGGTPKVALLAGQRQGLSSLGIPPYTLPASPPNVPIQVAPSAGASVQQGTASATTAAINVPVGSSIFVMLRTNSNVMNSNAQWTTVTDTAGNVYSIIQPTFNGTTTGVALAYSLNITHAIVSGSTKWTATQAVSASFWTIPAVFYLPAPASGTMALRASATAIGSGTTLSASLAGVQAGDLILSYVVATNYAEITDPAGFGDLQNFPPLAMPFRIAAATGTQVVNPTWDRTSPAALVAAAFSLGTTSAIPTVSAISPAGWTLPGGTSASITGTGFTGATAVTIGGVAATNVSVVSATQIRCVVPAGSAGAKSVVVTTPSGQNAANSLFTYGTYTSSLPAISALPQILECPDPFILNSGARCATKAEWAIRRVEIIEKLKFYCYGHVPAPVTVNVVSTSPDVVQTGGTMRKRTIVLSCSCPNGTLTPITIDMWIPVVKGTPFPNGVSGSGPWPLIYNVDRSFSPLENTPSVAQNESIGLPALNALVSRGYIIGSMGRDDFCLDWDDDGGDATYLTKCFPLFPFDRPGNGAAGFDWGTWGGWAWGMSRVMDYWMTQTSIVDTARIGLTGHSRGSNCAEFAGAMDPRITLIGANQNGLSLFRAASLDSWTHYLANESGWLSPRYPTTVGGTTVQSLGAKDLSGNNWPCPGNSARIPFDAHALVGCLAGTTPLGQPRLYLNLMSLIDPLREPREMGQRIIMAREIWAALGQPTSNCGLWYTNEPTINGNGHSFTAFMWNALLDFADLKWYGQALPAEILPPTVPSSQWTLTSASPVFSGLPAVYSWTHPTLT